MNPRMFIAEVARMIGRDKMPPWAKLPKDENELRFLMSCYGREPGARFTGRYAAYLSSPEWRWRRLVVMVLARGVCADCGGRAVQVHHLSYKRRGAESLSDLIPVCDECHAVRHPEKAGVGT